jgi:hypothetical protein
VHYALPLSSLIEIHKSPSRPGYLSWHRCVSTMPPTVLRAADAAPGVHYGQFKLVSLSSA